MLLTGYGNRISPPSLRLGRDGPPVTTQESRNRDEHDGPDDGHEPACRLGRGDTIPEEVGGTSTEQGTRDPHQHAARPSHRIGTGVAWTGKEPRSDTDQNPTNHND